MKRIKKMLTILLCVTMLVTCLAGCSSNENTTVKDNASESAGMTKSTDATATQAPAADTTTESTDTAAPTEATTTTDDATPVKETSKAIVGNIPCTMPIVSSPLSINVLISLSQSYSPNDNYVWQQYEEMTGIDVVWTEVASSERKEKVATALAGEEDLDLIMRCKLSADSLIQYGSQGMIIDLNENDMLQTYAPNAWAYLQSHPDTLACVQNPDGSIYALPQVNSGAELRVSRKLFINKTWLANVGMDIPTTTEELYDVLVAFKEQDANGNGDPTDEVPFSTADWASFQDVLFGAFGVGNRGQHNQIVDWDEANGCVRLIAAADGYKEMLQYMNRLYTEGLVDNELFTMTSANWTTKAADDRIGMFASTNLASLPGNMTDNWVGIEQSLEGPSGSTLWAPVRANFHSTGNAVIPATCDNVAEVLQWLDYFWTDEGTLFYHYGTEGETYVANDDGTYDYTQELYDMMESASFDDVVGRYSPYPGGGNPTVEVAPYFGGGEMEITAATSARALFEYGPDEYWPSFTFTTEENTELNAIQTDIKKYYEAARTEFVTGTKPFSDWNSYIEALKNMNLERMLEIYGAAVDRYHELLNNVQ